MAQVYYPGPEPRFHVSLMGSNVNVHPGPLYWYVQLSSFRER